MFKGSLISSKPVSISFTTDSGNAGTSSIGWFWMLKNKKHSSPPVEIIAPGAGKEWLKETIPAEAVRLQVDFTANSKATLSLSQGNGDKFADNVSGTGQWIFDVQ